MEKAPGRFFLLATGILYIILGMLGILTGLFADRITEFTYRLIPFEGLWQQTLRFEGAMGVHGASAPFLSIFFLIIGVCGVVFFKSRNKQITTALAIAGVVAFLVTIVGEIMFDALIPLAVVLLAIPVCFAAGANANRPNSKKIKYTPFILLIPWFFGITVFRLYPIAMTLWYSLRNWHTLEGDGGFVGLGNYIFLLQDRLFINSVVATLRYVFLGTPAVLISAFFIAFILNFKLKGVNLFRTAYYVPSILGGNVAVAIIWMQLFSSTGPINVVLESLGMDPVSWLRSATFAPFTLIFLSAWQFGSVMLIFLAALQNVSPTLYEAASIDGASKGRQLFVITLPIITPVVLFNSINVLLRHFQEFNAAFIITNRGPERATDFLNIRIYEAAFVHLNTGIASAMTWLFLAAIGVLTIILFSSSKYWVHYND